jgi:hypothetical protein
VRGAKTDDGVERFFRRSPWEVCDADVYRWRAAVEAEKRLTAQERIDG